MFGKTKKSRAGLTYFAQSTRLEGSLHVEGDCVVDGHIIGELTATGLIVVESAGIIEGQVTAEQVQVEGKITGNLECQRLTIAASGTVEGEIVTDKIEIFNGGQFIGSRVKDKPKLLENKQPELEIACSKAS
ncbi:polymer-forming cytoskeletal protein [Ferrimonas sp. SCSIO 43195]|uniref:bactofilin family protein n=1 Tax=Ferrimonas kyonanensis TaxID=364763 RepID=UPI000483D026|nr:polymer-forming cytoskeletal protein [Ferrimonas kyonanensis]USD36996.1 polymer-forming cytoskeletal protein [Ferrimonas sp. SCSIO 43195]